MKVILKSRLAHADVLEDIKEILTHYIMGIKNIPWCATIPSNFAYPDQLLIRMRHIRTEGLTSQTMAAQLHSFKALRMYLMHTDILLELAAKIDIVAYRICNFTLVRFFHSQLDRDINYRPFRKDFTRPTPGNPYHPLTDSEYSAVYETFSRVWNSRQLDIIDISDSDDDDDQDEEKKDEDDDDNEGRGGSEWKEPDEGSNGGEEKEENQNDEVIVEEPSDSPSYSSEEKEPESSHPFPNYDEDNDDPFVGTAAECDDSRRDSNPWEVVSAELGPWDEELTFPSQRGRHRCSTNEDAQRLDFITVHHLDSRAAPSQPLAATEIRSPTNDSDTGRKPNFHRPNNQEESADNEAMAMTKPSTEHLTCQLQEQPLEQLTHPDLTQSEYDNCSKCHSGFGVF
jgi:hypothetical protein